MNKLITLVMTVLFGLQSQAQVSVQGFKLHHCTQERVCLEILGDSAQRSAFVEIWSVKNAEVKTLSLKKGETLHKWTEITAIVDEFGGVVTLINSEGVEVAQISLQNLEIYNIQ